MTNEPEELTPEPKAEKPVIEPNVVVPAANTSNKNIWITLGIIVALLCLCSVLCLALGATGVGKIMVEKAPIETVLSTFMEDMEAKDVESAYALFSPRSQRQTPISDLEKMLQGNNYFLFEGYQSLSIQNINLTATANMDPDLPQGMVATVDGIISYEDSFTGQFYAVLEKVNGIWKIYNININVPPDKFH